VGVDQVPTTLANKAKKKNYSKTSWFMFLRRPALVNRVSLLRAVSSPAPLGGWSQSLKRSPLLNFSWLAPMVPIEA
jgi:hypothetical protein